SAAVGHLAGRFGATALRRYGATALRRFRGLPGFSVPFRLLGAESACFDAVWHRETRKAPRNRAVAAKIRKVCTIRAGRGDTPRRNRGRPYRLARLKPSASAASGLA